MDLSDARHNINSLVACGAKVEYNEELWDLFRKSWCLIQEELNWRAVNLPRSPFTITKVEPKVTFQCKGQGAIDNTCDDCAEDMA